MGETFVSRKITRGLTRINGLQRRIYLGNLDARRDWGVGAVAATCGHWKCSGPV